MRASTLALCSSLALTACAQAPAPAPQAPPPPAPAVVAAPAPAPVMFVRDDLPAALAEAGRSSKLVFVDAWAPWCHTCLSMHEEVLDRPELGAFAARYVFASIDTERASAAPFAARYAMKVWPTLFVLDPRDGAVVAMHGGGASLEELSAFLDGAAQGREGPGPAALVVAHEAFVARDFARAAAAYREAAPLLGGARRSEALLGAVRAAWSAGEHAACAELGRAHLGEVNGGAAAGDFAFYVGRCAAALPAGPERAALEALVLERLGELWAGPARGASVDDRVDVGGMFASALRDAGRADEARKTDELRLGMLEMAAARAETPEAAAVHDYARMNLYLALGRGAEAVAMLEERTRQLPDRYEPVARLAQALLGTGQAERALAHAERAIGMVEGPRRLLYLAMRSRALDALHDDLALRASLAEERDGWLAFPEAQRDATRLAAIDARLAELTKPQPPPKRQR